MSESKAIYALDRRVAKVVDGAVTSYVYDTSMENPLAFGDITLEFDGTASPILKRRWMYCGAVDEPVGFKAYAASSGISSGSEPEVGKVVAGSEYDGDCQITQTFCTLSQPCGQDPLA